MNRSSALYEARGLSFYYDLDQTRVHALDKVDIDIRPGEFLLIMGPSGSGKSTLLNLLGLIEPIQDGQILFQGLDLKAQNAKQLNHIRRFDIGFIFQSFLLFDMLSAAENIEYFLAKQGLKTRERKQRVAEALRMVELERQAQQRPPQLSGGQRQRVAIARALAKKPKVIIADEPTASLDQNTAREILLILRRLTEEGVTVIIASHDPLVREFASRRLNIVDGQLVSETLHAL